MLLVKFVEILNQRMKKWYNKQSNKILCFDTVVEQYVNFDWILTLLRAEVRKIVLFNAVAVTILAPGEFVFESDVFLVSFVDADFWVLLLSLEEASLALQTFWSIIVKIIWDWYMYPLLITSSEPRIHSIAWITFRSKFTFAEFPYRIRFELLANLEALKNEECNCYEVQWMYCKQWQEMQRRWPTINCNNLIIC